MSNRTFVCFACRTTERVEISRMTRRCRKCHAPSEHVYYKFRIPRRDDDDGWAALMPKVREVNRTIKENWLQELRADEERYSQVLAEAPPHRKTRATAKLREIRDKLSKLEEWR